MNGSFLKAYRIRFVHLFYPIIMKKTNLMNFLYPFVMVDGVQRFIAQHPSHGLSVVSAPAPVMQRPDVTSPGGTNPILMRQHPPVQVTGNGLEIVSTSRSTKSQRVRGASNSMRLRQMEMRENQAYVYS